MVKLLRNVYLNLQHVQDSSSIEIKLSMNLAWILPCRARWLMQKPAVPQAYSMLYETPATPYAGMTTSNLADQLSNKSSVIRQAQNMLRGALGNYLI
jgi:hypothetical protein